MDREHAAQLAARPADPPQGAELLGAGRVRAARRQLRPERPLRQPEPGRQLLPLRRRGGALDHALLLPPRRRRPARSGGGSVRVRAQYPLRHLLDQPASRSATTRTSCRRPTSSRATSRPAAAAASATTRSPPTSPSCRRRSACWPRTAPVRALASRPRRRSTRRSGSAYVQQNYTDVGMADKTGGATTRYQMYRNEIDNSGTGDILDTAAGLEESGRPQLLQQHVVRSGPARAGRRGGRLQHAAAGQRVERAGLRLLPHLHDQHRRRSPTRPTSGSR